jgi:NTP pyrophosphatase (non-canonical NTP hydrolase)
MKDTAMHISEFSYINRQRCESPNGFNHTLNSWSGSDWLTALVGEIGEAANVMKKLNRIRDGIPGNKEGEDEEALTAKLHREFADAYIYLDLLMQSYGIVPEMAVLNKFNETSQSIGYERSRDAKQTDSQRLGTPAATQGRLA